MPGQALLYLQDYQVYLASVAGWQAHQRDKARKNGYPGDQGNHERNRHFVLHGFNSEPAHHCKSNAWMHCQDD